MIVFNLFTYVPLVVKMKLQYQHDFWSLKTFVTYSDRNTMLEGVHIST